MGRWRMELLPGARSGIISRLIGENMQPYLVDVPVMLNIWTRPNIQRQTFAAIKKARPSILFLISDAGRNEEENRRIAESRKIVEDIDWDCQVHKLYYETNQGMYKVISEEFEFVFSKVDRCIFLEDDILANVDFFRFCAELLEKYKDDLRVTAINGMNPLGVYEEVEEDYFFTRANCISGYALWKRSYDLFKMDCFESAELRRLIKNARKYTNDLLNKSIDMQYELYRSGEGYRDHPPAVEFFRSFINVTQNQLDIVPKKNMISNIGANNGTNVGNIKLLPRRVQKLFALPTYSLSFPLKHPEYVMRDYYYENLMFQNWRKRLVDTVETVWFHLIYLSPKTNINKLINKITRKR